MKESCGGRDNMACGDMILFKFHETIKNSNQKRRNS